MANYINPFDFKEIFIDTALGSKDLFLFVFVMIYSYAAGRFNFSNTIYLTILVIGLLLFSGYLGFSIYVLVVAIIGIMVYKGVARFFN